MTEARKLTLPPMAAARPGARRDGLKLDNLKDWGDLRTRVSLALERDAEDGAVHNLDGTLKLEAGDEAGAVEAFRRAVEKSPDQTTFRRNLGALLLQRGAHAEARPHLTEVLRRHPEDRKARIALMRAEIALGEAERALAAAAPILADTQPDPEALRLAGTAAQMAERFPEAVAIFGRLAERVPDNAAVWAALGQAQLAACDLPSARAALERALILAPESPETLLAHGRVQLATLDAQGAIQSLLGAIRTAGDRNWMIRRVFSECKEADAAETGIALFSALVAEDQSNSNAFVALGLCLQETGKVQDALQSFEIATLVDPGNGQAFYALGDIARDLGDVPTAEAMFRRALEADPDSRHAVHALADILQKQEKLSCAASALEDFLARHPDDSNVLCELGGVLEQLRQDDAAIAAFERVCTLDPGNADAVALLTHVKRRNFDWTALPAEERIRGLGLTPPGVSPFYLLALDDSAERQWQRATVFGPRCFPAKDLPRDVAIARSHKIRIGYLSADFYDFAGMHLMIGMLERHDRNRFEIYALSYAVSRQDAMNRRIRGAVDGYYDVGTASAARIAEGCRELGLDIAIHRNGFTAHHRTQIFAHRAAPVQIAYLGYPSTMGLDYIDYMVGDRVTIPDEARAFYSEKIIYMPHSYQPNDAGRPLEPCALPRSAHGLPEDGVVLCCFNNSFKIGPEEAGIWFRVMRDHADAVLWLLSPGAAGERALRAEAARQGVAPERIVFADKVSNAAHLARHVHADLFVDSFAYNAHTTASDALWMGVPVLTRQGSQFAARVAASLLQAVGLPDTITTSAAEYERLLRILVSDRDRLGALRRKLVAQRATAPLFDTESYTRALEDGFAQAVARHREGKPPADIVVEAPRRDS